MAINEAEFRKRKQAAETAQRTRDRAAGQLEAATERLKSEFDCGTIKDAEALAKKLDRDAERKEGAYETAVATFEEDWGEHLDED